MAVFALFGGALFWAYAGPRATADGPHGLPVTLRRSETLLRVAAAVAAASGIGWLAGTIANATGGWETVVDLDMLRVFFFETPFGVPAIVRLAFFGVLIVIVVAPMPTSVRIGASLGAGTMLLISQAWFGHAVDGNTSLRRALMIFSYLAHLLAAAGWVGGLPILAFAITERRDVADPSATLDLLLRYSTLATVAVSVIVSSGIANTAFHADGNLVDLAMSRYGVVLFTKVALVAMMLVLAGINRFRIMPRLHGSGDRAALGHLRVTVALEALLAILVLGAAAVLGITPPPR